MTQLLLSLSLTYLKKDVLGYVTAANINESNEKITRLKKMLAILIIVINIFTAFSMYCFKCVSLFSLEKYFFICIMVYLKMT